MPRDLAETIAGLRAPSAGSIFLDARPTVELFRTQRSRFTWTDAPLPGTWSVESYLGWTRRLVDRTTMPTVDETLRRFSLVPTRREKIEKLSRTFRRKLAIAGAYVSGAEFIVLDDPTARWTTAPRDARVSPRLFGPRPVPEVEFSSEAEAELTSTLVDGLSDRRLLVFSANEESPLLDRGFSAHRFFGATITPFTATSADAHGGHLVSVAENVEALLAALGSNATQRSAHLLFVGGAVSAVEIFRAAESASALVSEVRPLRTRAPSLQSPPENEVST